MINTSKRRNRSNLKIDFGLIIREDYIKNIKSNSLVLHGYNQDEAFIIYFTEKKLL